MRSIAGLMLVALGAGTASGEQEPEYPSIPFEMLTGDHLNLVLTATDPDRVHQFYGAILGLEPMPDIDFPGETYMIRYLGGDTEIKFIVTPGDTRSPEPGGIEAALGIRRMTIYLPEERRDVVLDELLANGYEQTLYHVVSWPGEGQVHAALVRDGDDNSVELIFLPAVNEATLAHEFEIVLHVSDADEAKKFIHGVLGVKSRWKWAKDRDWLPWKKDRQPDVYQVGATRLVVFETEEELPAVAGPPSDGVGYRLVQFLVQDVEAVRNRIANRGGTIHTEPFPLGELATIMFVEGPDGILFEFAGPQGGAAAAETDNN